jgi:hypothetical protein
VPTISDGWRQRRYLAMSTDRGSDWGAGVPVRALVFPRHRPNGRARMEQVGSGEALGNLLQAGGWVSLDRQDLSRMLEWLLATPAYTIAFNSADEACALLADL